jgi:hypothetical protein
MSTSRPWPVASACALSLAVSVWDVASAISHEDVVGSPGLLVLILALTLVPVLLTVAAFLQQNWARIILAVISTFGILAIPIIMIVGEETAGAIDTETVLYALADALLIVLLFLPASNVWYRARSASGVNPHRVG